MKKLLFVILCMLGSMYFCVAQNKVQEQEEKEDISASKTIEFMQRAGSLHVKQFYPARIIKTISFQVLIITDVLTNEKMGCLRIETQYASGYISNNYIGTMDSDEIDACIKSLIYLKDNLLNTQPNVYTECLYRTRDNVTIGAYFKENTKNWAPFVQPKISSNSMKAISKADIDEIILILRDAQSIINTELSTN